MGKQQFHEQLHIGEKSVPLFNEPGLYYRMMPNKTLAVKAEKNAKGMKKLKDRVTLMAC